MAESTASSALLQVHYQNTVEDWKSLQESFTAWQRFMSRWGAAIVLTAMGVVCSFPATALFVSLGQWTAVWLGWLVMTVLVAALLVFAVRATAPPDPKILRPATLVLHPDYLEVASDRGWERRDWSLIRRLQLTDKLLILHRDDGLVFAVPRRAFVSPEAAQEFARAMQQYQEQAKSPANDQAPAPWQDSSGPPVVFAADTLQASFSSAAPELIDAQAGMVLHAVDEKPTKRPKSATTFGWVLLLTISVLVLLLFSRNDQSQLSTLGGLVAFLGLTFVMIWPVFRAVRFLTARKQKPPVRETRTITISPRGVSLWAPRLETRTDWEAIDAIQENERLIVFSAHRPTLVHLYIIPKSAFPDEHEARHFAETAARYRRAASDRLAEQELAPVAAVETGNPYQPPQAR
jgi:hypothetical protein